MRENRNQAVRAERREGGRFQGHARPHFSGAEIIEPAEGGLPKSFGSEIDVDFGIVMDGQITPQSVHSRDDGCVFAAADNVEVVWRKGGGNQRTELFEQ